MLGKGAALIPSSKKRSGPGTTLDIPLGHKDAAFVRSHFDGMEVQINDAPRANEIMVAVAVTDSGRPLPRVGGLTVADWRLLASVLRISLRRLRKPAEEGEAAVELAVVFREIGERTGWREAGRYGCRVDGERRRAAGCI